MQKIRILTTEMPQSPMLREIFERVAMNSQDMEIVDASFKKSQLMNKIREIDADVVIVDLEEHELPKIYSNWTATIFAPVIVGIADDGRRILANARQVGVNELMDTIRALTRNSHKRSKL
jgi:AmiR/NasT family two-component response regulator